MCDEPKFSFSVGGQTVYSDTIDGIGTIITLIGQRELTEQALRNDLAQLRQRFEESAPTSHAQVVAERAAAIRARDQALARLREAVARSVNPPVVALTGTKAARHLRAQIAKAIRLHDQCLRRYAAYRKANPPRRKGRR